MAECANYSCSTSNQGISGPASALFTPLPALTKGIPNPDSSQGGPGIDWESILPKLDPYPIRHKQSNYDKVSRQTRPNINFRDILQGNQYQRGNPLENKTHTPLALSTPLTLSMPINQITTPGYQGNSSQVPYRVAA